VIFLGLVGLLAAGFASPGSMWPSLVALLAIITGSAIIGPEFSTGALQLIVSKPIRRSVYLLSRVTGVFASVVLAAFVALAAETAARLLRGDEALPWLRLLTMFGGALATSLLVIAMLTLLGSVTRAYFNVAIYLGAEAALSTMQVVLGTVRIRGQAVGAFLEQHPAIERGLATVDDVLFASVPNELTGPWLLRVVVTVAVALALACAAFERREVPYGAD
jgi:ABC-type transport system involved in multi-copper enzyme maturation permease subunit